MIPDFVNLPGAPFGVLPAGIHWTTLKEIEVRFATTDHRRWLFEGIANVADALRLAGCRTMYLDGSYVTAKDRPDDFDGCWDPAGVRAAKLDPVLLDFDNERAAQKWKYRGEMFIASHTTGGLAFLEFLQVERHSGGQKGILGVRLAPLSTLQ